VKGGALVTKYKPKIRNIFANRRGDASMRLLISLKAFNKADLKFNGRT
jgi:hypothetical protein